MTKVTNNWMRHTYTKQLLFILNSNFTECPVLFAKPDNPIYDRYMYYFI